MTQIYADRVKETTTTTGTGTLTLAGHAVGFQSFSVVGNANTCDYCITGGNGIDWEVGNGTYTLSGTTLSRDSVYASSNSGIKISLTGTSTVFLTQSAQTVPQSFVSTQTANNTASALTWTALPGYSYFEIIIANLKCGSDVALQLQFGTGVTPTWVTSGYFFSGEVFGSGGFNTTFTSEVGTSIEVGELFSTGNGCCGKLTISGGMSLVGSTSYKPSDGHMYLRIVQGNGGTSTPTAIRLTNASAANLTSGQATLYGYRS